MLMPNEFLKESSYMELKKKAENRKEWPFGPFQGASVIPCGLFSSNSRPMYLRFVDCWKLGFR